MIEIKSIQQSQVLAPPKKKRKSYYRSRRKIYTWDEANQKWYFLTAHDQDKIKFCYAEGVAENIGGVNVITRFDTYHLHKPGTIMMQYSTLLELERSIQSASHEWGKRVTTIKNAAETMRLEYERDFAEKWNTEADGHNEMILGFMLKNKITRI